MINVSKYFQHSKNAEGSTHFLGHETDISYSSGDILLMSMLLKPKTQKIKEHTINSSSTNNENTVERQRTVTSQQQPPPIHSQFSIFPKSSFTIYFTSPKWIFPPSSPTYNSHFYTFPWVAVVERLHCGCKQHNADILFYPITLEGCQGITNEIPKNPFPDADKMDNKEPLC